MLGLASSEGLGVAVRMLRIDSAMLVNEYLIAVWVNGSETRRTCCLFIRLSRELNALALQMTLNISYITEVVDILRIAIPPRIECEDISFKHTLKETDYGISILQYQPVL